MASKACLASIIAQCPQWGETCNSAFGIVRIGISAMSNGLTRLAAPRQQRRCLHFVHHRPGHSSKIRQRKRSACSAWRGSFASR